MHTSNMTMRMDRTTSTKNMRKRGLKRLQSVLSLTAAMVMTSHTATGFMQSPSRNHFALSSLQKTSITSRPQPASTPTALNVWWFPGSDSGLDDDSCELVAVRIEKTSANSRRIAGDIIVPRPVEDVWAILTDYDNLSVHVPNLVESKRVNPLNKRVSTPHGVQGDGSYQCRLYQKGAQKIVGFEFGASVTMDMAEKVVRHDINEQRIIQFKCVESQFFSEFDGEWKVSWTTDPDDPSKLASLVEYIVDVRPRGPVPVQALEWRIREDVPTNLRAVKVASMNLGAEGVEALRNSQQQNRQGNMTYTVPKKTVTAGRFSNVSASSGQQLLDMAATVSKKAVTTARAQTSKLAPVRVQWYEDETMAAYLGGSSGGNRR
jgi:hypothetical protein